MTRIRPARRHYGGDRHGWHPFGKSQPLAGFLDYLAECERLRLEGESWASQVSEEDKVGRVGGVTITEDTLLSLPPMPFWMQRIFGRPEPAIFGPDAENRHYQWPFWQFVHPSYRDKVIPSSAHLKRWKAAHLKWETALPVCIWLEDIDPCPHLFPSMAEQLSEELNGSKPSKKWLKQAAEANLQKTEIHGIISWLQSIGSRDVLDDIGHVWPETAIYWTLLKDYEETFNQPKAQPLSAIQRATLNKPNGETPHGLGSLNGAAMPTPHHDDAQWEHVRTRALRQFHYWGRVPFVDVDGTVEKMRWPSDPRLLSDRNIERTITAVWLIRFHAPHVMAIKHIAQTGYDLTARLFSANLGGASLRSARGVTACIAALGGLGASKEAAWVEVAKDTRDLQRGQKTTQKPTA